MATLGMTGPSRPNLPQTVEQITSKAQTYAYDAQVRIKYWLSSANAMLKQAAIYEREGNDEQTYFLLFRHAHLVLTNLAVHPEAKDKAIAPQLAQAKQAVKTNLEKLDALKPRIRKRYERYVEIMEEREARRAAAVLANRRASQETFEYDDTGSLRQSQQLQGHDHQELAVQLARNEFSRRAASRKAESVADRHAPRSGGDDLSQRMRAIRARVEPDGRDTRPSQNDYTRHGENTSTLKYPAVPTGHRVGTRSPADLNTVSAQHPERDSLRQPPSIPAKPNRIPVAELPLRPEKVSAKLDKAGQHAHEEAYTFSPTAFLENGTPLRTLFLPPTLRTTFLRVAHSNTLSNLETCGFLAGTVIANALFISKLIVPSQTATSDTCEMTNESQLFDYVDSEADLMVLGWIHTHPRQTCFMSSRDLHTHAGYQMMLAESVAIVCAPSMGDTSHGGDWGAYRLTDPPGKKAILSCEKPGIFHPHEVDNVYTDALRPGHVVEAKGLEFDVVDLRSM